MMDMLNPEDCLDFSEKCQGEVTYRGTPPDGMRTFPRCVHHDEQRWSSYENSIERFAQSDLVPDWFDPSYAGESWDGD